MRMISRDTLQNGRNPGRGFTLVELLIVISIIGVLIALLMPAVNSARESGRRAQCSNNLHQMALGCTALESKYGYFPSGGWGWQWAGEADRGYGVTQPGGWHFNILPFIDQTDLHDMGTGLAQAGDTTTSNAARMKQGMLQAQIPVAVFLCPTRHNKVQAFPRASSGSYVNINEPAPIIGRSDYAANSGTNYGAATVSMSGGQGNGPDQSYSPNFDWSQIDGTVNSVGGEAATGVIYRASQCTLAMIKDGASNTYLIGERYLDPNCYYTGDCCDNDQGWDQGFDWDTIRGTGQNYVNANYPGLPPPASSATTWMPIPPAQDRPGVNYNSGCSWNFGSAHEAGFNMAFCDGTVRLMNYSIDPLIHMELGHRSDGEPTDMSTINAGK